MELRQFGFTGLNVSALGFGAGHIGDYNSDEKPINKLLNTAVDLGVNLIDTARGYGASEDRIGRFLSHRRNEIILSTKVGYSIPGYKDWTYECIIAGVDEALRLLRTDYIDIVHLHSCPADILKNNGVIDALEKVKEDGKIKVTAYSGENENLSYALETGRIGSIQTSINIADQRNLDSLLPRAKVKGLGVIAKRPAANTAWKFKELPAGMYAEEYWHRLKRMNLHHHFDLQEIALRFAAFTWGVDSVIVGTANIDHLKQNVKLIEKGPLSYDLYYEIRNAFKQNDVSWVGQL
ncbi:MAG: aldo/keto reductase [Ignavibacteriaceae bacterium]|nr:aldo/keto reductase [Ignavibacteriaceae bacterium]